MQGNTKKRIYIAHPLTSYGSPAKNHERVTQICKEITELYPDIVPISPIHAFIYHSWSGSQERVMDCCINLLSCCNELWLYGQWWNSKGCREEYSFAKKNNIPITIWG